MGLLKHLLFWPVTGPLFLTEFSMSKVHGAVREELTDDTAVKQQLMQLQLELELGDVDEDEYAQQEAQLMQRLREVREWRERFGMATSGGPVQVAGEAEAEAEPSEEADRGPRIASPGEAEISFDFGDEE